MEYVQRGRIWSVRRKIYDGDEVLGDFASFAGIAELGYFEAQSKQAKHVFPICTDLWTVQTR